MSKSLRKALMTHSKSQNKYNKKTIPENWKSFKKYGNKCAEILKNVKKKILNINIKNVIDNRTFTSIDQSFFADTQKAVNDIMTKRLKLKKVAKTLTH